MRAAYKMEHIDKVSALIDTILTKDWQHAYKLIVMSCPILIMARPYPKYPCPFLLPETLSSIVDTP